MKKEENKGLTKKRVIIGISLLAIVIISAIVIFITSNPEKKVENKPEENKIDTPIKETNNNELILKEELSFEINSEVLISDLLDTNNTLKIKNNDEKIATSKLGEQEVTIKYLLNEEEQEKSVTINIIDTTAPVIESKSELTTTVNKKIDLLKDIKVTDNSKEEIKATVEGEYDFKKEGTYKLKYVAIDSSDNKVEKEFTLKVNKANNNNTSNNKPNNQTNNKPSTNTNTSSENNGNSNNDNIIEDDTKYSTVEEFKQYKPTLKATPLLTTIDIEITNESEFYPLNNNGPYVVYYEATIKGPNKNEKQDMFTGWVVGLQINSEYEITIKPYNKDKNGNKVYGQASIIKVKTLSDYNYNSEEKQFIDNLFNEINSNRTTKFVKDSKVQLAAQMCAVYDGNLHTYYKTCLKDAGISYNNIFASSKEDYNPFYGKISYKEFYQKHKNTFDKVGYSRVGIGYHEGSIYVIMVSLCEDVDTTGLNTNTCK